MSKQQYFREQQAEDLRDAAHEQNKMLGRQLRDDALVSILYDTGFRTGETLEFREHWFSNELDEVHIPSWAQKGWPGDKSLPATTLKLDKIDIGATRTLQNYLNSN